MAAKDKLPDDVPPVPTPPAVEPPPAAPAAAAPPAPPAPEAPAAPPPPADVPGYQAAPPAGPAPVPPPPAANPYAVPQPYSVAQPQTPGQPPVYGQPGYGQPVYGQAGYGQPSAPNGLSVASMILGIAGVVLSFFGGIGFFPALAAVITAHMAVKRQPAAKPFWLTGLITGYVGIAISVFYLIAIIFFAAFMAAYPGG